MLADKVAECGVGYGMGIYSDAELLSLMTGLDEATASQIDFGDILASGNIPGVGPKTVMKIMAVREYAERIAKVPVKKVDIIRGPDDAYDMVKTRFLFEHREVFCILLMNIKGHVIGLKDISIGSMTGSVVHPREVFFEAIKLHAAAMILVHNHPSGDPTPSKEDIKITRQLVECGKIMDIPVRDHIIVGNEKYISFMEEGFMAS
ncbi:DNA repair protein RadC [Anaerovibrio lipolyticus DSM 3074]|uniref:DNA repair protein RadC n=1 Tax=Anaerovibrio lipolyticus DSM 3074 TaxID=1120997 RepID=A0A1M6CJ35_9FIRM|nr:DNA repair protein RadC [Anaerovibrio lipolyticus]SHI61042.1 DNA repair protein RadC [Anaerovibrio lipolyticus DSM 3074]